MKRIRVKRFQGVYFREHSTRKYDGKSDKCYDISYKTSNGRKVWEKIGWASEGYTAQSAAQLRAERIRTLRHGEELPSKKSEPTFGEVWKRYSEWAQTNRKSFKAETNRYEKHLKSALAKHTLSSISPFMLEKIKSDLNKRGYSQQTIKHCLVLVRQVVNKAVTWKMWDGKNPVKDVKVPQPNNRRERFLTHEEADLLLEELSKVSADYHDIALLSLHTGMRAGEIFALRWSDINLEDGVISILDPKPGKSQKAYMTQKVKLIFKTRPADASPGDLVFKSRKGKQISEVSDTFARVIERLGFNDGVNDRRHKVCFHTLRHTFASWLALEGTPILTIKELLRHSSLAMTERYSHLIPDHKKQAVAIFDK